MAPDYSQEGRVRALRFLNGGPTFRVDDVGQDRGNSAVEMARSSTKSFFGSTYSFSASPESAGGILGLGSANIYDVVRNNPNAVMLVGHSYTTRMALKDQASNPAVWAYNREAKTLMRYGAGGDVMQDFGYLSHIKAYISDGQDAMITSANATKSAYNKQFNVYQRSRDQKFVSQVQKAADFLQGKSSLPTEKDAPNLLFSGNRNGSPDNSAAGFFAGLLENTTGSVHYRTAELQVGSAQYNALITQAAKGRDITLMVNMASEGGEVSGKQGLNAALAIQAKGKGNVTIKTAGVDEPFGHTNDLVINDPKQGYITLDGSQRGTGSKPGTGGMTGGTTDVSVINKGQGAARTAKFIINSMSQAKTFTGTKAPIIRETLYTAQLSKYMPVLGTAQLRYSIDPTMLRDTREWALLNMRYKVNARLAEGWTNPRGEDRTRDVLNEFEHTRGLGESLYRQLSASHGLSFEDDSVPEAVRNFDLGMQARTVGQSDWWSPGGYAMLAAAGAFGLSSGFGNTKIFTGTPSMPKFQARTPRAASVWHPPMVQPSLGNRIGAAIPSWERTKASFAKGWDKVDRATHHISGLNVTHAAMAGGLAYLASTAVQMAFTDDAFVQVGNRGPLASMAIRISRDLDKQVDSMWDNGAPDQAGGKMIESTMTGGFDLMQGLTLNLAGYHWLSLAFMRVTSGAWDSIDRILKHQAGAQGVQSKTGWGRGLAFSHWADKKLSSIYGTYLDELWRPLLKPLGKDYSNFAEKHANMMLKGDDKFRHVRLDMFKAQDELFAKGVLSFISEEGLGGIFKALSPKLAVDTTVQLGMSLGGLKFDWTNKKVRISGGLAQDLHDIWHNRGILDELRAKIAAVDAPGGGPKAIHDLEDFARTSAVRKLLAKGERQTLAELQKAALSANRAELKAMEDAWNAAPPNFVQTFEGATKDFGALRGSYTNAAFDEFYTMEQSTVRTRAGGSAFYNFNYHLTKAITGVNAGFYSALGAQTKTNMTVRGFAGMGERAFWFTTAGVLFGDALLGEVGAASRVTVGEQRAFAESMNARQQELGGMRSEMMVWYQPGMNRWDQDWGSWGQQNRAGMAAIVGSAAAFGGAVQGARRFGARGAGWGGALGLAIGVASGYFASKTIASTAGLTASAAKLFTTEKFGAWVQNLSNMYLRERGLRTEVSGPGAFSEGVFSAVGGGLDERERRRMDVIGQVLDRSDTGVQADILGLYALMGPGEASRLASAKYGDAYALQWSPNSMVATFTAAANKMQDKTRFSLTVQAPAIFQIGYSLVLPVGIKHGRDAYGNETWSPTYIQGGSAEKWAYAAISAKAVESIWSLAGDPEIADSIRRHTRAGATGVKAGVLHNTFVGNRLNSWANMIDSAATSEHIAAKIYRGGTVAGNFYKGALNLGFSVAQQLGGYAHRRYVNHGAAKAMNQIGMTPEIIRSILEGGEDTRYFGTTKLAAVDEWLGKAEQVAEGRAMNADQRKAIGREINSWAVHAQARDVSWRKKDLSGTNTKAVEKWRSSGFNTTTRQLSRVGGVAAVLLAGAGLAQGLFGSAGYEQDVTQAWAGAMSWAHEWNNSGNLFKSAVAIPTLFALNYMGIGHATHPDKSPGATRKDSIYGDGKSRKGYDQSATFWQSLTRPFQQQYDAITGTWYAGPGAAFLGTGSFGAVMDEQGDMQVWSKSYVQYTVIPGVSWAFARGAIGLKQRVDMQDFTSSVNFNAGHAQSNAYAMISNRARLKKQGRMAAVGKMFHDQSAAGTLGRSGQTEMYRRTELTRWLTTNGVGLDAAVYFFVDRKQRHYDKQGRAMPTSNRFMPPILSEGFTAKFDNTSGLIKTNRSMYDMFRSTTGRAFATGELAEMDMDSNTQIVNANSGYDAPKGTNPYNEYVQDKYGNMGIFGGMVFTGLVFAGAYTLAMIATTVENFNSKELGAELSRTTAGFVKGEEGAKYMTMYGVDPTKDGRLVFKGQGGGGWKGASYQNPNHKYWLIGVGDKFFTYGPKGLMTSDLMGGHHGTMWSAAQGLGEGAQMNLVPMRSIFREITELSFENRMSDQLLGKAEGAIGQRTGLDRLVKGKGRLMESVQSAAREGNRAIKEAYREAQAADLAGDTSRAKAMRELEAHYQKTFKNLQILKRALKTGGAFAVDDKVQKAFDLLDTEHRRIKDVTGATFASTKQGLDLYAQQHDIDGKRIIDDATGKHMPGMDKSQSLFDTIRSDIKTTSREAPLMRSVLDGTIFRRGDLAFKSLEEAMGLVDANISHGIKTTGGLAAIMNHSLQAQAQRMGTWLVGDTAAKSEWADWSKAEAHRQAVSSMNGTMMSSHITDDNMYKSMDDMLKDFFGRTQSGETVDLTKEASWRQFMNDLPEGERLGMQEEMGRVVGKEHQGEVKKTAVNMIRWAWSGGTKPRIVQGFKVGGKLLMGAFTAAMTAKGYTGTLFGLGEAGDTTRAYSDRLYAARAGIEDTKLMMESLGFPVGMAIGYMGAGMKTGFREAMAFAEAGGTTGLRAWGAGVKGAMLSGLGTAEAHVTTVTGAKGIQTAGTLVRAGYTARLGAMASIKVAAKTGLGRFAAIGAVGLVGYSAARVLGASNEAGVVAGAGLAGLAALGLLTLTGPIGLVVSIGVSMIGYKMIEGHVNKWLDGAFKGKERDVTKWMDNHTWAAGALGVLGRAGAQWQNLMDGTFGEWAKMKDDPSKNVVQKFAGGASGMVHWALGSMNTSSKAYAFFDPERAPATSLSSQPEHWRMAGNMGNAAFAMSMTPLWHGEMRDAVNQKLSEQERLRVGSAESMSREWFHESMFGSQAPLGQSIMTSAVDPHKNSSIWKNFGNLSTFGEATKMQINRRSQATQFVMTRLLERWDVWNDWSRSSQARWDWSAKRANLAENPKGPGGANVFKVRSQYHTVMLGVHSKSWGTIDPDLSVEMRSQVRGYTKPGEMNKPGPGVTTSQAPALTPKKAGISKPVTVSEPKAPAQVASLDSRSPFVKGIDWILGGDASAAEMPINDFAASSSNKMMGEVKKGQNPLGRRLARADDKKTDKPNQSFAAGAMGAIGKFLGWFGSAVSSAFGAAASAVGSAVNNMMSGLNWTGPSENADISQKLMGGINNRYKNPPGASSNAECYNYSWTLVGSAGGAKHWTKAQPTKEGSGQSIAHLQTMMQSGKLRVGDVIWSTYSGEHSQDPQSRTGSKGFGNHWFTYMGGGKFADQFKHDWSLEGMMRNIPGRKIDTIYHTMSDSGHVRTYAGGTNAGNKSDHNGAMSGASGGGLFRTVRDSLRQKLTDSKVHPELRERMIMAVNEFAKVNPAAAERLYIPPWGGYRSFAQQDQNARENPEAVRKGTIAHAGHSHHGMGATSHANEHRGVGMAFDIMEEGTTASSTKVSIKLHESTAWFKFLKANGSRFGLGHLGSKGVPGTYEPWHWELDANRHRNQEALATGRSGNATPGTNPAMLPGVKTSASASGHLDGSEHPLTQWTSGSNNGITNHMRQNLMKYDPLVQAAAKRFGVPVNLVRAVILQESGGENGKRSWVGASGLMQVMPFHSARAVKLTGSSNLMDPAVNIMTGASILADSLRTKSYGGDVALGIAGYNGGGGANAMSKDVGHTHQRVWQNPNNWKGRDSYGQTAHYVEAVGAYYLALNKATGGNTAGLNVELLERAVAAAHTKNRGNLSAGGGSGTYTVAAQDEGAAVDNHGEGGEARTGASIYKDPHTQRMVARATYPDGTKWSSSWDHHFAPIEDSGLDNHHTNNQSYGGV